MCALQARVTVELGLIVTPLLARTTAVLEWGLWLGGLRTWPQLPVLLPTSKGAAPLLPRHTHGLGLYLAAAHVRLFLASLHLGDLPGRHLTSLHNWVRPKAGVMHGSLARRALCKSFH